MKITLPLFLLLFACGQMLAQQTVGIFQNDSLSLNGYTLFNKGESTYLIDNCGFLVHEWESDFISSSAVYLMENGNLLRTCRIPGNPFTGGGIAGRIEVLDWDGSVVWSYDYASNEYHNHHDVELMPNGNLLILAWENYTAEEAEARGRYPATVEESGLWPEKVVEVEMVGTNEINVVWEWKLWDHLIQDIDDSLDGFGTISEHPELVDINATVVTGGASQGEKSDWIHANAVSYNADLDQVAISCRNLSEIWIVDHSTTTAEAAGHTGGDSGKGGDLLYRYGNPRMYDRGGAADQMFYVQHNVTWLPEGHPHAGKMMVFNNGEERFPSLTDYSSIDIWEPPTDGDGNYLIDSGEPFGPTELEWTYSEPSFFSANISGAQGLSNGNVLVCEGREGRFFEVNEAGEIVWEYISPVSPFGPVFQGQEPMNNAIFRVLRYAEDYPAFAGRDLAPGAPIELEPWAIDCEIYSDNPVSAVASTRLEGVRLLQNPISQFLNIENTSGQPVRIQVSDWVGRPVFESNFAEQNITVKTAGWPNGMYVLRVAGIDGREGLTKKILKF